MKRKRAAAASKAKRCKPRGDYDDSVTTSKPATTTTTATKTSTASNPAGTGKFKGEATYYYTGLVACGTYHKDSEYIAAVADSRFDSYPGAGSNPNKNPICGKRVRAYYKGKQVEVTIRDRCIGCAHNDLDFTPTAFKKLAPLSDGRLKGMTWDYI